jgi:hypothetical protein
MPKGGGKGRDPHKPTDETRLRVLRGAALGITHEGLAKLLGISKATLAKHYQDELDRAKDALIEEIGGAMYAKAQDGDVGAQKYIMGCRAGWSEKQIHEHSGKDGGPIVMWGPKDAD